MYVGQSCLAYEFYEARQASGTAGETVGFLQRHVRMDLEAHSTEVARE